MVKETIERNKLKKDPKYYLAHSVELINSVRKWELKMQSKYDIDLINPFLGNTFENVEELKSLGTRKKVIDYMSRKIGLDLSIKIVKYDLELLRKCDGLVAVFKSPSIGTAQEIFVAAYIYRIPVFVICYNYTKHPWLQTLATLSGGQVFKYKTHFEKWLHEQGFSKRF